MPRHRRILTTRADQVHPIQVRRAFLTDNDQARLATFTSLDDDLVELCRLDGTIQTVRVHHPRPLARVLARDDVCRLDGRPLLLVNQQYGVLAVATGPANPPAELAVLVVCSLDDEGGVVELVSASDDQPAWQTFALRQ